MIKPSTIHRVGLAAACLFVSAATAAAGAADQAPAPALPDPPPAAEQPATNRATRAEQAAAAALPAGRKAFTPEHLRLQAEVQLFQTTAPAYEQGGSLWVQFGQAAPVPLDANNAPKAFAAIETAEQALELCDCLTWGIRLTNEKDYQNLLELYRSVGLQPAEPAGRGPRRNYAETITRNKEDGSFKVAFAAIVLPRGMGAAVQIGRFAFQVSGKGEVQAAEPELYFTGPMLNWQTAVSAADDMTEALEFQRKQKLLEDRRNLLLDVAFNRYSPVLAPAAVAKYPTHEVIADPAEAKATAPAAPDAGNLSGDAGGVSGANGRLATAAVEPTRWDEFDAPPAAMVATPDASVETTEDINRRLSAVVQSFQLPTPFFETGRGSNPPLTATDSAPQIDPTLAPAAIAGAAAPLALPPAALAANPTDPFPVMNNELRNRAPINDWNWRNVSQDADNQPPPNQPPALPQEQNQPGQQGASWNVNWPNDNEINKQVQEVVNDNPPVTNPEPEVQWKQEQIEVPTVLIAPPQNDSLPPPVNNDCPDDTPPQIAAPAGQQSPGQSYYNGCATAAEEDTF